MIDDLRERLEEIRKIRKKDGIKMLWVTPKCIELARETAEYLSELPEARGRVTVPEVLMLSVQEFMASNMIMTNEEREEFIAEACGEKEK